MLMVQKKNAGDFKMYDHVSVREPKMQAACSGGAEEMKPIFLAYAAIVAMAHVLYWIFV